MRPSSKQCRYCLKQTHNKGGVCNRCLDKRVKPAEPPGAALERERLSRQPGARVLTGDGRDGE